MRRSVVQNIINGLFSAFFIISFSQQVQAQQCGMDAYVKYMAAKNPSMYSRINAYDDALAIEQQQKFKTEATSGAGTVRIIPVVFHIIHNYGPVDNVPKKLVLDQLATMNKNYQKQNPDTVNVRSVFKPLIANMGIEFRLATKDPNGKCTDGIDRIASTLTYAGNDNVKALEQWDPKKYLNIWVVANIDLGSPPGTIVAGYSYFPTMNQPSLDGIVVRADQITSGNSTLTHEAGHYFNLYHPFETSFGGYECGNNCNTSGDHVCDTPPTTGSDNHCDMSLNTCTKDNYNGQGDRPDMIENYMDYSTCPHMFTLGQLARVNAALLNTVRASLYTASNLAATGTDSASLAASGCAVPVPDFYASSYTVCAGGSISFYDNSYNASVSSYQWSIPSAVAAKGSSTSSVNPVFVFPDTGMYSVTLKVTNGNGSNQLIKKAYIHVVPAVSSIARVSESFENGMPAGWSVSKDNNGLGWVLNNKTGFSGRYSMSMNMMNGQTDSSYTFTLPDINMTANHSYNLSFKLAYAMAKSTSTDIFRIVQKDDCDPQAKYAGVYFLTGASMVSAKTATQTSTFVPAADEWRTINVDLSGYKASQKLSIRFFAQTRGGGNSLYIDDINFGDLTGVADQTAVNGGIDIYPNPTSGTFTLMLPQNLMGNLQLQALDLSGKELGNKTLNAETRNIEISKEALNIYKDGVYFIKLTDGTNTFVQKLIILQ